MPLTLPNYGYQVDPQLAALANVSQAIQQGQRPVWGMNLGQAPLTAGEGAGAALQATGNVLADPRNAWMGLGPLAGVMRFRRVPDLGKDLGGFDIPYKQLFKQDPGAVNKESYVWGRDVENNIAKNMMKDPNGPSFDLHTAATEHYRNMLPEEQARITQSMRGQLDLRQEMLRQMNGVGAGDVPTDLQLRRFGYKPAPEYKTGQNPSDYYKQLGYRKGPPTTK